MREEIEQIVFNARAGTLAEITAHAERMGETVELFICRAIATQKKQDIEFCKEHNLKY